MIGCRSSCLNKNKLFSGPVSTSMSLVQRSLTVSACPVAYAYALTRLSTVIYMNCAIKSFISVTSVLPR